MRLICKLRVYYTDKSFAELDNLLFYNTREKDVPLTIIIDFDDIEKFD